MEKIIFRIIMDRSGSPGGEAMFGFSDRQPTGEMNPMKRQRYLSGFCIDSEKLAEELAAVNNRIVRWIILPGF